jgi:hypothetical protein
VRKYFTRRCIGLHVAALILIPAFLVAAWWQYGAARSGNDLSWAYVFEWPFFAVYAAYIWWKLIHDQHTPLDRLWAAKARIAADAVGTPINQIPGWALDKDLTRSVVESSAVAVKELEMASGARSAAIGSPGQQRANVLTRASEPGTESDISDGYGLSTLDPNAIDQSPLDDPAGLVIDVPVVEVRSVRDEDLDAYNRYLADLSWRDPPKRWSSRRG